MYISRRFNAHILTTCLFVGKLIEICAVVRCCGGGGERFGYSRTNALAYMTVT